MTPTPEPALTDAETLASAQNIVDGNPFGHNEAHWIAHLALSQAAELASLREAKEQALTDAEMAHSQDAHRIAEEVLRPDEFSTVSERLMAVELKRQAAELARLRAAATVAIPEGLHSDTVDLVRAFAGALAAKLGRAQEKYGYSNGWLTDDWEGDCAKALTEHVAKGDPLDVAAYCAFMWRRGWATRCAAAEADKARIAELEREFADLALTASGERGKLIDRVMADKIKLGAAEAEAARLRSVVETALRYAFDKERRNCLVDMIDILRAALHTEVNDG